MSERAILLGWPHAGLALAAAPLTKLFTEARANDVPPRTVYPVLLLPLLWPMYLVHQFENGAAHVGSATMHHAYNAGLLTSTVPFLALGVWVVRACIRAVLPAREVPLVIASARAP
jgi:hypothetical protein